MLDSTLLMSAAPKPVAVRACFGLVKSGPTGPLSSDTGALVEGLRSLFCVPLVVDMLLAILGMPHAQCSRKIGCKKSVGFNMKRGSRLGVEGLLAEDLGHRPTNAIRCGMVGFDPITGGLPGSPEANLSEPSYGVVSFSCIELLFRCKVY